MLAGLVKGPRFERFQASTSPHEARHFFGAAVGERFEALYTVAIAPSFLL
jgi:hypothetical protein